MAGFPEMVAWLLLCVCTGVTASHVSPTHTPSLCAGKPIMEKLDRLEHLLKSTQEAPQCPCSSGEYVSATNGLSLTNKMSVLEAKLEATGAHMEAVKSKLEAVETKLGASETELEAAKKNLEATQTKLEAAQRRLEVAEANLNATGTELQSKTGSTFVRWGRKSCTNASDLVYTGVGGGGHWTHTGAAVNMLCLTMEPQSENITLPQYYTYLYGAEYEHIQNHHDHDVPCSVCRATQSTTIMIPATPSCPTGWTTQYSGHLVAGYHGHNAATEYVCLDRNPEDMPNGHQNHNGKLLYHTFAQCGSLPCPPYSNMALVLCVVCSK